MVWMDAIAESGRNPVSKHQIQASHGERAGWRRTGRLKLYPKIFPGADEDGEGFIFACSADHEQDWHS